MFMDWPHHETSLRVSPVHYIDTRLSKYFMITWVNQLLIAVRIYSRQMCYCRPYKYLMLISTSTYQKQRTSVSHETQFVSTNMVVAKQLFEDYGYREHGWSFLDGYIIGDSFREHGWRLLGCWLRRLCFLRRPRSRDDNSQWRTWFKYCFVLSIINQLYENSWAT